MLSVKSHLLVRCDLCAHKRTFWQASVEHLSFYLFMVSCDEFCRVKTQYNSKILGITCEGELSVYAQSNLCEKMRYYPYYYRPPIEWTAIRTWSELGKKRSNTLKQWPTNCHVIQCCEVCLMKEGKIPNKHTGIIQNTTYFFSSDTILN